ncbi:MAG: hypothetical protein JSW54_09235 [Fidelibacterota bacterium]|nr:MAG: hypothetical protein JSW54_09235 [Candidatus Neomarinimicrobiota bacterium]
MSKKVNICQFLKLCFASSLLLMILLDGCSKSSLPSENYSLLSVDLMWDFMGDSVSIDLDGQELFTSRVRTEPGAGVAWFDRFEVSVDSHRISVSILDSDIHSDTLVMVEDTLTVLIFYDRSTMHIYFDHFDGLLLHNEV